MSLKAEWYRVFSCGDMNAQMMNERHREVAELVKLVKLPMSGL